MSEWRQSGVATQLPTEASETAVCKGVLSKLMFSGISGGLLNRHPELARQNTHSDFMKWKVDAPLSTISLHFILEPERRDG